MKHFFINILIILFFFILLIFPEIVFDGASSGLLLWFNIVLPTLLPFLIISGILINTSAIHILVKCTSPVFCRLFRVSEYGSFAVLCGFLCGYPMGGKITSDLLHSERITLTEAKYLLSFCNNTSPMFIISFVMHQNLHASHLIFPALGILFLSPVLCSFLFRHFYPLSYRPDYISHHKPSVNQKKLSKSNLLDDCIMNSFETITKIGGYIIMFSICTHLVSALPFTHTIFDLILLPFLEITNGVLSLSQSLISFQDKFVIVLALVSFGGWCSVAQTKCMISDAGIPLLPYVIEKLITAMVTSLLATFFFQLY